MPDKFDKILESYTKLMHEIVIRTQVIDGLLTDVNNTGWLISDIECIALNLRKIAELIVYANLVSHEEEYDNLHPKSKYDWRIEGLLKKMRVINPDFYPYPSRRKASPDGNIYIHDLPVGTWMTETELVEMYNKCSNLIHVKNPFTASVNYKDYTSKFEEWIMKIAELLSHHTVALADGKHSITCVMHSTTDEKPSTVLMQAVYLGDGLKRLQVIRGGLTPPMPD